MRYLSLFSGIEAATVAWQPLGWEPAAFAEIEPFPCALLAHHYPDVPNLGDVTKVTEADIFALGSIDIVIFGSPCQDLSVAGKRKGLAGERSGLFHTAIDIIGWARTHGGCRWALWENVPGAFSSNAGRDFAVVVGELAGLDPDDLCPPKGWGTEGAAVGSEGMVEWSVLDAQWFGVAQRRRRVFALADFGDWSGRPPVLLEPARLRRDSAPSREARKVAPTIPARSTGGGGLGTDFDCDGGLIHCHDVAPTLNAAFGSKLGLEDQHIRGGGGCSLPDTSQCLTTGTGMRYDAETETLIPTIGGGFDVAHTLRAEGFDASEDGTGRGTLLVPVAYIDTMPTMRSGGSSASASHGQVSGDTRDEYVVPVAISFGAQMSVPQVDFDLNQTLQAKNPMAVAFTCKDHGADAGEIAPTLRSMGHDGSHANGGGQVAVAFDLRGREGGAMLEGPHDTANIRAASGGSSRSYVAHPMAVRRLTPRECERLQGFPDDYTLVPHRGKPAADGPRYKALGNSMAVPVIRWIGAGIDALELVS